MNSTIESFFHEQNINEALRRIYDQVPGGTCAGSTHCCSESVNTFYSEYINMVLLLERQGDLAEYTKRAVSYYLTELVRSQKCPMLQESGLCALYEARPLPCRIFGHLCQEEYEANYEEVFEENIASVAFLAEEYGITVPEEVSHQKVLFCTNFKSDGSFTLDDRDDLVDQLFAIESKFLMHDLLEPEQFNLSLVQWFAYDTLGIERAQQLRIKVSQEISKTGTSETLKEVLNSLN